MTSNNLVWAGAGVLLLCLVMPVVATGQPPVASFTGIPVSGAAPLTVTFVDSSTNGPDSWSWDFGDGNSSWSEQNPVHTFGSSGTYTVSLTATNFYGSNTVTKTGYIIVTSPVTGCIVISTPGSYVLQNDVLNSGATECINITSSNVTFDGDGHTIDGTDGMSTSGIYVYNASSRLANVTIRNVVLTDWSDGALFWNVNSSSIDGITATSNIVGIDIPGGDWDLSLSNNNASSNTIGISVNGQDVRVDNNIAMGNANYGISVVSPWNSVTNNRISDFPYMGILLGNTAAHNSVVNNTITGTGVWGGIYLSDPTTQFNTISNNIVSNCNNALYIDRASNNTIANNYFNITQSVYFYSPVYENTWNSTKSAGTNIIRGHSFGGNYWANPSGTGFSQTCLDADSDGICDSSYTIATLNIDNLPLTKTEPPAVSFSASPTSGKLPLPVSFTDHSTNNPSGWAWFFGDEEFSQPWTQQTTNAGWISRAYSGTVVTPDGSIVLMGGDDGGSFRNDVWRSTDNGVTWTQVNASAGWTTREGPSSVILPDGSIILTGGFDPSGFVYINDTWESMDNGATWTEVNASSGWAKRAYHSSVVMPDGSIVLMGGQTVSIMGVSTKNDVWRSTDSGATWTEVNASAGWAARAHHTSLAMPDGSIVLMGGYDSITGRKNDVWRSTDSGATWTEVNASAGWTARMGQSGVVSPDGSIVLMGGYDNSGPQNDVWRSTDSGATWTEVNASAGWTARTGQNSVVMPDGSIVLMGGYDTSNALRNDVWRLDPAGSSVQNPSHTYTTPGIYQVSLQASNSGGYNSSRKAGYVEVSDVQADFSWACNATVPYRVDFYNTSTTSFPPTESLFWEFGDGSTNWLDPAPQHTYTDTTPRTVNLTVWDALNVDNMTSKTVTPCAPSLPLVSSFSAAPMSGKAPLPVSFTDTSSGSPTGWAWFFGDEDYAGAWTEINGSSGWRSRTAAGSIVMPDGSIVLMGGWDQGTTFMNDVWRSGDDGATWAPVNPDPDWSPRYSHSSVILPDGSIILTGGIDSGGVRNDTWRSTDGGATWVLMNSSSGWSARGGHSTVAMPDGSIVLTGGSAPGFLGNDVWLSTDDGTTWTLINASPGWSARYGHSTVAMPDGSVVLTGGTDGYVADGDIWRSMDDGATWTKVSDSTMVSTRFAHSSVVSPNGNIVLMGGYVLHATPGSGPKHDVYRSDTYGNTWWEPNANPGWTARYGHSSVETPDGTIVLMGGTDSGGVTNDTWRFNPAGSSVQNPSHTYTIAGTYSVALQAYNAKSHSSTEKTIQVESSAPTVTGIIPSRGANGDTVPIEAITGTNFVSGATVILGAPEGSRYATATNVNVVSPTLITCDLPLIEVEPGTYPVSVINPDTQYGTLYNAFTVTAPVLVDFSADPKSGEVPLDVSFTDLSTNNPTDWAWFFGDEDYATPWSLETGSASWSGRRGHSGVALPDGHIVLMGGFTGTDDTNETWQSTDGGSTWTEVNASSGWSARSLQASVVLPDGSIVLMGGGSQIDMANDVWRSTDEGTTWTKLTGNAGWSARYAPVSVAMPDGTIVLMGGFDGSNRNDTWKSTDGGSTWTLVNANNGWSARDGVNAVLAADGSIIIMGGVDDSTFCTNDTWRSADGGNTWTRMNASSGWTSRYGASPVAIPDGSILLLGGYDDKDKPLSDMWRTTDDGATWNLVNATNDWTAGGVAVELYDGSIHLMGGYDGSLYRNQVWSLWPVKSSDKNPVHEYTAPGTYTVALQAHNSFGANSTLKVAYITALAPAPTLSGINPTHGVNTGTVSITELSGTNFMTGATVNLTKSGQQDIAATNVVVFSPTIITCDFPLTGAATGQWDIVVTNPDLQSATLTNGFTVTAPPPNVIADFTGSPAFGTKPLSVTFTDTSTGNPTGWAWYFGDENYTGAWTELNASAGWPARSDYNSVVMPDGSIILMGGTDGTSVYNDVWRSTDDGTTWTEMNASAGWSARWIFSSVALPDGNIVLMGGSSGTTGFGNRQNDVWRSADEGATWTEVNASAGWSARNLHRTVVMPDGSIILMGGHSDASYMNDVWRSADDGATWTEVTASAGWSQRNAQSTVVTPDGSIVLMGGFNGAGLNDVWESTDYGAHWTRVNASAGWSTRWSFGSTAMPDGSILLTGGGTDPDGTYTNDTWRSTDNGATWAQVNASNGWTKRIAFSSVAVPDGSIVLMGGYDGSSCKNETWRLVPAGSSARNPSHTYTTPGTYQVALQAYNAGGYNSTRKAGYITVAAPAPTLSGINPTHGVNTGTVSITEISGTNFITGATVNLTKTGQPDIAATNVVVFSPTIITCDFPITGAATGQWNVVVTNPDLQSATLTNGFTVTAPTPNVIADFTGSPSFGTTPLSVSFTDTSTGNPTGWAWYFGDENYTEPWTLVNASAGWSGRYSHTSVVMPDGTLVLMGGYDLVDYLKNDTWMSTDKGTTWTQANPSSGWTARAGQTGIAMPDGSIVLMGGQDGSGSYRNDVWKSSDDGATWTLVNATAGWTARGGLTSVLVPDGSIVLMGGYDSGGWKNDTWRSTDNGATWIRMNASSGWTARSAPNSVAMPDGSIVLMDGSGPGASYLNDTWRSTDNGATWTQINASAGWVGRAGDSTVVLPDASILLTGGVDYFDNLDDTWRSTDNGATWTEVNNSAAWTARAGHSSVVMPDGSIILTGGRESISSYDNDVWRFNPVGSSLQNPSHTYTTPGTYKVSLQAYNAGGYNSTRKAGYITVASGLTTGPVHNLNSGLNYTTIQAAIDSATEGDTIKVDSGLYTEHVSVTIPVTLSGNDSGAGLPTISGGTTGIPVSVSANHVTLQGFVLTNSTADIPVTAQNARIIGNTFTTYGLSVTNGLNTEIIGNTMAEPSSDGIVIYTSQATSIVHNYITQKGGSGIFLSSAAMTTIADNTITGNGLLGSDHSGIGMDYSANCVIENNTITDNHWAGIRPIGSNYLTAYNNTITGNQYGIFWRSSDIGDVVYLNNFQNSVAQGATYSGDTGTLNSTLPQGYYYGGKSFTKIVGNYWSDYEGTDSNGDGLGDTPYTIGSGSDSAPLMGWWSGPNTTVIGEPVKLPGPVADFTGTPTSGLTPLGVSFTDQSSNSPNGWAWYFGDESYAQPWTEISASADWTPRSGHSGVVLPNGSIVVTGGSDSGGPENDTWRSTDNGLTWVRVNASSGWKARYVHSSVALPDGSIILMGGRDSNSNPLNDVWRSTDEGATWTQVTAHADWPARYYHTSVGLSDGSIVVMGGADGTANLKNDTWQSTDQGKTWTLMNASSGWLGRNAHSTVAMPDGSIVLMGGSSTNGIKNDTWRSTDSGATWIELNASSGWSSRQAHTSVAMPDGSIVLMGGTLGFGVLQNDVWRSTDNGMTWTETNANAGWAERIDDSSVVTPDGSIILLGGWTPGAILKNDVWRFQPTGSSAQNPLHTYTTPGTYQVALQVYNANGYNSTRKAGYIMISAPAPTVTGITPGTGLNTGTASVTNLAGTGFVTGATVKLTKSGQTDIMATNVVVVSPTRITCDLPISGAAAGTWNVIVTNPDLQSATLIGGFTIGFPVTANFKGTPTSGTVPLGVTFTDLSLNSPTGWAWYFGDESYTASWSQMSTGAGWTPRSGSSNVVLQNGSILLTGGYDNGGSHKNDVWRSLDGGASWTQINASAGWTGRNGHSTVILPGGSIVLTGGNDGSPESDVWRSTDNGVTWTEVTASPGWSPRYVHSAVALPTGSIVLMGGQDSGGNPMNDTWRSTDGGNTWTEVNASSGWTKRWDFSTVALPDGSIVLMGGYSAGTGTPGNDTWRSKDEGATWTLMNESSGWQARDALGSVAMPDGTIVLMGGSTGTSYLNDVWRSDDEGATWTRANAGAGWTARYVYSSVVTPDGSIVLMGGRNGGGDLNDVWRLVTAGSSAQNPPVHTYSEPGTYSVALQAYNTFSSDSRLKAAYITATALAPTVTGVSPSNGPLAGGTPVSITGTGFTYPCLVKFGSLAVSSYIVNSDTSISTISPPGAAGTVDVTITTPGGESATSSADEFSYVNAPTVSSISPLTGVNTGTVSVTDLAGTGFISGASVKLVKSGQTDIIATNVVVVTATRITCDLPITGAATGSWDVMVTNPDTQYGTLASGFMVTAPSASAPTVTGITPSSGFNVSPISITNLAGTNFASGAAVKLNRTGYSDIPGTGVTVAGPTKITCTFDLTGAVTGTYNVVVTNSDGKNGMLAGGFTIDNTTSVLPPEVLTAVEVVIKDPAILDNDVSTVTVSASPDAVQGNTQVTQWGSGKDAFTMPYDGYFIFIDDEPNANWEHPARWVAVSSDGTRTTVFNAWSPPNGITLDYAAGKSINVNGGDVTDPASNCDYYECSHCYALLISGGIDKDNNPSRFFNDINNTYWMLRNKYCYPRNHIVVLMSDGTGSGTDQLTQSTPTKTYISSPTDFGLGDAAQGWTDVNGSATRANVINNLTMFSQTLTKADTLFIFTTGHGGNDTKPRSGNSRLYLWGANENITDTDFVAPLKKSAAKAIVMTMEQCFSGGFITDFLIPANQTRIVTTAANSDEPSWGAAFSTPWINGLFTNNADTNGNGVVSLNEAFVYANASDDYARLKIEHPQLADNATGTSSSWNLSTCARILSCPAVKAIPGSTNAPRTLDGDCLFEDVNGDGKFTSADPIAFFSNFEWIAANEPDLNAFDFYTNQRLDFGDVVKLYQMAKAKGV